MIESSLEKKLQRADYTLLRYQLQFDEDFSLPAYALLRLRRELNRLLKNGLGDNWNHAAIRVLLQPPLPTDPVLLRRVQQPAPGFIIRIERLLACDFRAGDLLTLPVCFFGQGMLLAESFTRLIEALGSVGLCRNAGRFHLESIEDGSGFSAEKRLWSGGPFKIAPTILDLSRRFDCVHGMSARFELLTPARLLRSSRPLFRPAFVEVFPFILRRVTSMLATWADLENIFDIRYLLECAAKVVESDNCLSWQDWRPLQKHEEAGGLCGSVTLSGNELGNIWPILRIGELYGIGKGAAFGAGSYRLI